MAGVGPAYRGVAEVAEEHVDCLVILWWPLTAAVEVIEPVRQSDGVRRAGTAARRSCDAVLAVTRRAADYPVGGMPARTGRPVHAAGIHRFEI
jgi:hypothetical protein